MTAPFLERSFAGKLQRNPYTRKLKRNPTTKKLIRDPDGFHPYCCCVSTNPNPPGQYYPLHRCDGVNDGRVWYSSIPPTAPPFVIKWNGNGKCYQTLPNEALVDGLPIDNGFVIIPNCNDCSCQCPTCGICGCPDSSGGESGCIASGWLITLSGVTLCGGGGCFRCIGGLGFKDANFNGTACWRFDRTAGTDFNPSQNVLTQVFNLDPTGTDCTTPATGGPAVETNTSYMSLLTFTRAYNFSTGMIDWGVQINMYHDAAGGGSNWIVFQGYTSSHDCMSALSFVNSTMNICDDGTTSTCQPFSGGIVTATPCGC